MRYQLIFSQSDCVKRRYRNGVACAKRCTLCRVRTKTVTTWTATTTTTDVIPLQRAIVLIASGRKLEAFFYIQNGTIKEKSCSNSLEQKERVLFQNKGQITSSTGKHLTYTTLYLSFPIPIPCRLFVASSLPRPSPSPNQTLALFLGFAGLTKTWIGSCLIFCFCGVHGVFVQGVLITAETK